MSTRGSWHTLSSMSAADFDVGQRVIVNETERTRADGIAGWHGSIVGNPRSMERGILAVGGLLAISIALVTAGCGGTRTVTKTVTVGGTTNTLGAPRQVVFYGHIKSLTRKGSRFELRFDPAWLLFGVTAERAAVEDRVLQPGAHGPNDSYTVEEGHRLLTFIVLPTAQITVLTQGLRSTTIPISELAQIIRGKNPRHRSLFDPSNSSGFWIRVGNKYPNPAVSLDQQYHP